MNMNYPESGQGPLTFKRNVKEINPVRIITFREWIAAKIENPNKIDEEFRGLELGKKNERERG